MTEKNSAIDTAILPQYRGSEAMYEKFLFAIHEEGAPIGRSANSERVKGVDESELVADAFHYFTTKKKELECEFYDEISDIIGIGDAQLFCDVIANDWYDGKRLRCGPRVQRLKASIYDYLSDVLGGNGEIPKVVQKWDSCIGAGPLFERGVIANILKVNSYLMHSHIAKWILIHPKYYDISMDDVFLRRGIDISEPITSNMYIEWDYINSYSMAFSAPEKFAQMSHKGTPALLHGDIELFRGRILFFSPFVPGMAVGQLELGMIPARRPLPIRHQGLHSGIHEYLLPPRP